MPLFFFAGFPEANNFINKRQDKFLTDNLSENIIKFRDYLNAHGIVATIRRELGSDIDAACGQLRRQNLQS